MRWKDFSTTEYKKVDITLEKEISGLFNRRSYNSDLAERRIS